MRTATWRQDNLITEIEQGERVRQQKEIQYIVGIRFFLHNRLHNVTSLRKTDGTSFGWFCDCGEAGR
jgi:hypothetical protein